MHLGIGSNRLLVLSAFRITAFQGDLKTKETMLENTKVLQEKSNEQLAEAIQLVAAFRYNSVILYLITLLKLPAFSFRWSNMSLSYIIL